MPKLLKPFLLRKEKVEYQAIIEQMERETEFNGESVWILFFAILIASLGLNTNSTAVIIGAMLISPLMGPIMGLGLGISILNRSLLKKALFNYLFAVALGIVTSTIYFLFSPIKEIHFNILHSEIFERTLPNIFSLFIAFFGGLAGMLATSMKEKGNVIHGVAIATALMPPICTAGYGLATLNFRFFFGAIILFLINTVFIALATIIIARVLKFPFKTIEKNFLQKQFTPGNITYEEYQEKKKNLENNINKSLKK